MFVCWIDTADDVESRDFSLDNSIMQNSSLGEMMVIVSKIVLFPLYISFLKRFSHIHLIRLIRIIIDVSRPRKIEL